MTVVEGLNQRVVLGMDVLGREGIVIDSERDSAALTVNDDALAAQHVNARNHALIQPGDDRQANTSH